MVTNRRWPAATRARRPIVAAVRVCGSGEDRPDGHNDHDDPDRDAGATMTDQSQRYEHDKESREQAGRSLPSTTFGPPFWAIRRSGAEKPAVPQRPSPHRRLSLDTSRASIKHVTERAGIASVTVAFDRYGHLYPNEDRQLADQLAHIGLYQ